MGRVVVLKDSSGDHIVAAVGDHRDRLRWPSWKVDHDGNVWGPNLFANWHRFCPSDYRETKGPYPEPVRRVVEWLASIEDLGQVLHRDGGMWALRPGTTGPPGDHRGPDRL